MKDGIFENCWEFLGCSEEAKAKCPAYLSDMGKECWMVAGNLTEVNCCTVAGGTKMNCEKCEWFKMNYKK